MKKDDPIVWVGLGIGLAIIGFLFVEGYNPVLGVVWTIMHGEIGGIPYRYVLVAAVCFMFYGGYLWTKKLPKNSN